MVEILIKADDEGIVIDVQDPESDKQNSTWLTYDEIGEGNPGLSGDAGGNVITLDLGGSSDATVKIGNIGYIRVTVDSAVDRVSIEIVDNGRNVIRTVKQDFQAKVAS